MAVAIAAVASCQVGLDQTLQYVKQRRMFGRRLGDLQYPALKVPCLPSVGACVCVPLTRAALASWLN